MDPQKDPQKDQNRDPKKDQNQDPNRDPKKASKKLRKLNMTSITLIQILFYCFAALTIAAASMVILSKNPVRAVLFLVLAFFSMGGIWILLEADFLAMTLVLVYVGAVMVLFLFVVMMLDIDIAALRSSFMRHLPIGILVSVLVVTVLITALMKDQWIVSANIEIAPHDVHYSEVKKLGELLYTDYLYPFELAGVLLLVAIVAAISLTFRGHRNSRTQEPSQQIAVTKKDRLRIIQFPKTEEPQGLQGPEGSKI